MKMREIIDIIRLTEAKIPEALLAPRYFHGTRKQYAKTVLAHGLYPPDFAADGREKNSALRPVAGRVYLTPDAKYATLYGACLLVINRETLVADLLPDEDEIGEIFHWIMQKDFHDLDRTREVHKSNPEFIARMEILNSREQWENVSNFRTFMQRTLTANTQRQVISGEYAWWAKAGKASLKKMPEYMVRWLISIGVHVSCEGRVIPDEAWLIQKKGLLSDGSNLSEVATRLDYDKANVTDMPPKGPPQKYLATYIYNKNFAYPEKPAVLKTTTGTITATSEEEARMEAEIFIEHTTKKAEYKLVSLEKI